jgi:hypothetical protein
MSRRCANTFGPHGLREKWDSRYRFLSVFFSGEKILPLISTIHPNCGFPFMREHWHNGRPMARTLVRGFRNSARAVHGGQDELEPNRLPFRNAQGKKSVLLKL